MSAQQAWMSQSKPAFWILQPMTVSSVWSCKCADLLIKFLLPAPWLYYMSLSTIFKMWKYCFKMIKWCEFVSMWQHKVCLQNVIRESRLDKIIVYYCVMCKYSKFWRSIEGHWDTFQLFIFVYWMWLALVLV
jgi:hypothetical protein